MPNEEMTYRDGVNIRFDAMQKEFREIRSDIARDNIAFRDSLARIETDMHNGFEVMHRKQDFTNGKVKKVITALIALAAFTLGVGFSGGGNLISLIKIIGL